MYEPRVMDVPGFDTPLKEASLEEFMSALPIDHMAQKQLSDLRRLAMDGAKATSELLEALKKIRELEAERQRLDAKFDELHVQWAMQVDDLNFQLSELSPGANSETQRISVERYGELKNTYAEKATEPVKPEGVFVKAMAGKLPCPHCSKLISTLPGPWARHMNFAHPELLRVTPATPEPL